MKVGIADKMKNIKNFRASRPYQVCNAYSGSTYSTPQDLTLRKETLKRIRKLATIFYTDVKEFENDLPSYMWSGVLKDLGLEVFGMKGEDSSIQRQVKQWFQSAHIFMLQGMDYTYFLEYIRNLQRADPKQKTFWNKFLALFDAQVYAKLGNWGLAADSLYGFVNSQFANMKSAMQYLLVEKALTFALASTYGVQNDDKKKGGVYLPSYLLPYLDSDTYFEDPFEMLDGFNENEQQEAMGHLAFVPVVKLERRLLQNKSMNLINEGVYWMFNVLKNFPNDSKKYHKCLKRSFNLLVTVCVNVPMNNDLFKEITNVVNFYSEKEQLKHSEMAQLDYFSTVANLTQYRKEFIEETDYNKSTTFLAQQRCPRFFIQLRVKCE